MAKLRLRIDFEPAGSLGPGKVALLEAIRRCGSISSAARDLDMSYRRAWLLIDDLNQTFRQPVVSAVVGGRKGGGTGVTAFGESVISHYREMEAEAHASLARTRWRRPAAMRMLANARSRKTGPSAANRSGTATGARPCSAACRSSRRDG
jgi:molybdate transport system regulatory protein